MNICSQLGVQRWACVVWCFHVALIAIHNIQSIGVIFPFLLCSLYLQPHLIFSILLLLLSFRCCCCHVVLLLYWLLPMPALFSVSSHCWCSSLFLLIFLFCFKNKWVILVMRYAICDRNRKMRNKSGNIGLFNICSSILIFLLLFLYVFYFSLYWVLCAYWLNRDYCLHWYIYIEKC